MSAKVEFSIPENMVQAKCIEEGCGFITEGDSAVDAFTDWWDHKAEIHPEVTPEPEPEPENSVEIPIGTPPRPND